MGGVQRAGLLREPARVAAVPLAQAGHLRGERPRPAGGAHLAQGGAYEHGPHGEHEEHHGQCPGQATGGAEQGTEELVPQPHQRGHGVVEDV